MPREPVVKKGHQPPGTEQPVGLNPPRGGSNVKPVIGVIKIEMKRQRLSPAHREDYESDAEFLAAARRYTAQCHEDVARNLRRMRVCVILTFVAGVVCAGALIANLLF